MDIEEQSKIIETIKSKFEENLGEKVHVEQDLGRSRISANTGIVYQVHPRLFILEVTRKRAPKARLSYQFADILTGIVTVTKDGEQLFENYRELLNVKKESEEDKDLSEDEAEDELIIT